jgi:hypothetical protein
MALLAAFAAVTVLAIQPGCIGYGGEGTIEEQFDRCLAGQWGEEGCTSGLSFASGGFASAEGEKCQMTYLIRDIHSGGFRLGTQCGQAENQTIEVWIIEDDQLKVGSSVTPFTTRHYRCEVTD